MKKALVLVLTVLLVSMMGMATVQAQDSTIEYGQTVSGEITNAAFEIAYTFSGSAGDALVIEMLAVDEYGDLSSPELILLDSQNNIVGDTTQQFSFFGRFSASYLAVVLPADDTYTILATRRDGRTGDSVGEFNLTLVVPTVLEADTAVSGTVSSEGSYDYYVATGDTAFSLLYSKSAGEFWPEVSVNILDPEDGAITGVGYITGDNLTVGAIGSFPAGQVYFITVGSHRSSFMTNEYYFDEATADYSLTLLADE